jgi:methionyl-tRNA synthetase
MEEKKSFYITTTLPYVNAEPHIGFAMEIVQADIIARAKELQGFEVFFNTGTDEHGQKIQQKAKELGKDPYEYVDESAETFKKLIPLLGLSQNIHFIRTTSEGHKKAAQEMWKRCEAAGDIYKKNYTVKYCVGCELEKTDSEIENGHCIIHPHLELEVRDEENYFFRFSKYGPKLLELYQKDFMVPDFRINEMRALIERGLEDFSISRLKEKMSWGVPVPGDENHVMYVWFDALTSYISTLGWPDNTENFEKFWVNGTPVQFAGKDQVRQQAAMWQAMLLSAELPNTKHIVIHGFLNVGGQKMSKSLGNVISPVEIVEKFGQEPFRIMMAGINQFEDTDVSMEGFDLTYKTNLVNGLGNLVARLLKVSEDNLETPVEISEWEDMSEFFAILNKFEVKNALEHIWRKVWDLDKEIQDAKPWESKDKEVINSLLTKLYSIARMLNVFMPETSAKIKQAIKENKKPENLFPRKDA